MEASEPLNHIIQMETDESAPVHSRVVIDNTAGQHLNRAVIAVCVVSLVILIGLLFLVAGRQQGLPGVLGVAGLCISLVALWSP